MTTIAYRDGVMAGDGRETCQNDEHSSWYILRDNCTKVYRLPNGALFGGAHSSEDIYRLHDALKRNLPLPKLEDIAGLLVKPNRRMYLYEGNVWQPLDGMKFYAVGSGATFAWPLLRAGHTALEAVKIAKSMDPFSGGKVSIVRLKK